jgi:prepilin peptidase CpaA
MISELASLREIQALMIVAPILVYIIVQDLRTYRIRNEAIVALLVLFGGFYLVNGDMASFTSHLIFGLAFFAVFLAMYWFGLMGGGDVKLLTVAFFWLGPENALPFSLLLGVLSLVYALGARLKLVPSYVHNGRMKVPFGPTIAISWSAAWLMRLAV